MAKNSALKKQNKEEDSFDFSDIMGYPADEDVMVGMMSGLVEASHHQMNMAMELTKLIVDKRSNSSMEEDEILSIFQRASQTIAHSSPIRELWEKMNS